MKRKTKFLGLCLSLMLTVMLCSVTTACDYFKTEPCPCEGPDSLYVAEYYESVTNPTFESVDEVLLYQNNTVADYEIGDIFRAMPEDVLTYVSTVCLKKYGEITIRDVVSEYKFNREVYDNLPNRNSTNTQPDEQSTANTAPPALEERQKPVDTTRTANNDNPKSI